MKRITLVAGIAAITLTGCVVQSFYPFCTEKSVVDSKPLLGEWKLQQYFNDDVSTNNLKPWVFEETETLLAVDKDNDVASFSYCLFTLGDNLFLDVKPMGPGQDAKLNELWRRSVHPTHVVCKVEVTGERLSLTLLNYKWVKKTTANADPKLPFLGETNNPTLYTATPEQWESFLRENAGNTNAFPATPSLVLVRPKKTS